MLFSAFLIFLVTSTASAAPAAEPSPAAKPSPQHQWTSPQLTNPFSLPNSNSYFPNGLGIPNFMSNGLPNSFGGGLAGGVGYPNVGYSTSGFNTGFTSPTSYSTQYSRRYQPGGYGNYGGYGGYQNYGGYNGYNPSRNYNYGYRNRYN